MHEPLIKKANFFVLTIILTILAFSAVYGLNEAFFNSHTLLFLFLNGTVIHVIPFAIYFSTTPGALSDFQFKPITFKNAFIIFLIAICIQPLVMVISTISGYFFGAELSTALNDFTEVPLIFTVITSSVLPAFFEELSFRGIVFSNLKGKPIVPACLFTGLLFGMIHLNGEQFFYAFMLGSIFCYFVYKTGSIFSSMIAHFTLNCTQILLFSLIPQGTETVNPSDYIGIFAKSDLLLTAVSIIPLIVLFVLFERNNKNNNQLAADTLQTALREEKPVENNTHDPWQNDFFKDSENENPETVFADYHHNSGESYITPSFVISFIIFLCFLAIFKLVEMWNIL